MAELIGDPMSLPQARRLALAAQGFSDPLPKGEPTRAHLRKVIGRTKLLQMDSVSIAVRAHYMPIFSRIGPYDHALLENAAWGTDRRRPRLLAEYWAHEAALIPVEDWPLFRWRMAEYRHGRWWREPDSTSRAELRIKVAEALAEIGPATSGELEAHLGHQRTRKQGTWWDRSEVKHVCEAMFAAGELSAIRRSGFTRHYGLAESIIPAAHVESEIAEDDAIRELIRRSVHALGVGTEADIRDYYRLSVKQARTMVAELVADGEIEPVRVAGWKQQAYRDPSITMPRTINRSALLSPFDPVVFFRPRAERLYDFEYRIEIYTPAAKRKHGYYVFPYLLGDKIVARVDLKVDRAADTLLALGSYGEDGIDPDNIAASLAADLNTMANWLGVSKVSVGRRGDLARPLTRQVAALS